MSIHQNIFSIKAKSSGIHCYEIICGGLGYHKNFDCGGSTKYEFIVLPMSQTKKELSGLNFLECAV